MANISDTYELRLRDVPIQLKNKVHAYRRIVETATGRKPTFTDALIELVDYSYKDLCVKRIEDHD